MVNENNTNGNNGNGNANGNGSGTWKQYEIWNGKAYAVAEKLVIGQKDFLTKRLFFACSSGRALEGMLERMPVGYQVVRVGEEALTWHNGAASEEGEYIETIHDPHFSNYR